MERQKTVYQRIVAAYRSGRGLRLTADDVAEIGSDGAIVSIAASDDEEDGSETADAKEKS